MPKRILRPSRLKTIGRLALSAAFVAAGAWAGLSGVAIAWVGVAFFGLGVFVFSINLLPNSAYLRIEPDGFTLCALFRSHSYRWSDVGPFSIGRIGPNRMVVFDFSDEYSGLCRTRQIASAMAGHEGGFPDSYGMSPEGLAQLLNEYREASTAI